jgi:hypothetical protein
MYKQRNKCQACHIIQLEGKRINNKVIPRSFAPPSMLSVLSVFKTSGACGGSKGRSIGPVVPSLADSHSLSSISSGLISVLAALFVESVLSQVLLLPHLESARDDDGASGGWTVSDRTLSPFKDANKVSFLEALTFIVGSRTSDSMEESSYKPFYVEILKT